jgi:hypothetical protein
MALYHAAMRNSCLGDSTTTKDLTPQDARVRHALFLCVRKFTRRIYCMASLFSIRTEVTAISDCFPVAVTSHFRAKFNVRQSNAPVICRFRTTRVMLRVQVWLKGPKSTLLALTDWDAVKNEKNSICTPPLGLHGLFQNKLYRLLPKLFNIILLISILF